MWYRRAHAERDIALTVERAELLEAFVDRLQQRVLQTCAASGEWHADFFDLRLAAVENRTDSKVEARPEMQAPYVQHAHDLLDPGETTSEAVRVVGECAYARTAVALAQYAHAEADI